MGSTQPALEETKIPDPPPGIWYPYGLKVNISFSNYRQRFGACAGAVSPCSCGTKVRYLDFLQRGATGVVLRPLLHATLILCIAQQAVAQNEAVDTAIQGRFDALLESILWLADPAPLEPFHQVALELDATEACVTLDETDMCGTTQLRVEKSTQHQVQIAPRNGFRFSHWLSGEGRLFGGETHESVLLAATNPLLPNLPGSGGLKAQSFWQMRPAIVPVCDESYVPENNGTHPWVDCRGDLLSSSFRFSDMLDEQDIVHTISILFYLDVNTENFNPDRPEEFVDREIEIVNQLFADSGVLIRVESAGIILIDLPVDGETNVSGIGQDMQFQRAPFENMLAELDSYAADLAHAFVKYEYDGTSCGYAYLSDPNGARVLHAAVSACFELAHGTRYKTLFAHELGHNLGLQHPTSRASNRPPHLSVGYGFVDGELETIMGYGGGIQLFSNGGVSVSADAYTGVPGDENANAAYALNKVRLDFARISDRRNSNRMGARRAGPFLRIGGISDEMTGPVREKKLSPVLGAHHARDH